jgi:hypothetical protein
MIDKDTLFDQEMKALYTQSLDILNTRYGLSTALGSIKKEIACLKKYNDIYVRTLQQEHFVYFEKLLIEKRSLILKSLDNDDWLKNGNIVIQFGKYIPALKDKCDNIKIMLSKIYVAAVELQDSAYAIVNDLNEEYVGDNKDLIRPSIILLHLMRLFYIVCEEDSSKLQLASMIGTLENDLNVKNRLIVTTTPQVPTIAPSTGAGLANVFTAITEGLKQVGVQLPDDFEPPSETQVNEVLNGILKNDALQGFIKNIAASINNNDDMGTTMNSVLKSALDPETIKMMQSSLVTTAEIAKENTLKK